MDRRCFSDRIKVTAEQKQNDKAQDLSRGKAEVKSMTNLKILPIKGLLNRELENSNCCNVSLARRFALGRHKKNDQWVFSVRCPVV
jgi:hypothetical protein